VFSRLSSLVIDGVAEPQGAERILDLDGVYVELQAVSPNEAANFPARRRTGRDRSIRLFRYHRVALAEAVLDWSGDQFRLLITQSSFGVTRIRSGI
jgi:hypothetical protein